ncbi:hypothetical protein [Sphingomonas sanxanigenens]|nr:hypothetical protein [Sphingomonas sanxanigenens]
MNIHSVHNPTANGMSLFSPIFGLAFGKTPPAPRRGTLSRGELRKIVTDLIG